MGEKKKKQNYRLWFEEKSKFSYFPILRSKSIPKPRFRFVVPPYNPSYCSFKSNKFFQIEVIAKNRLNNYKQYNSMLHAPVVFTACDATRHTYRTTSVGWQWNYKGLRRVRPLVEFINELTYAITMVNVVK